MSSAFKRQRQSGFGLVEIMVALVVGLLVVAGLVQIYLSNKQSYTVQEAQSRLQENVRLASIYLTSNIAKAGFRQNFQDGESDIFTKGIISGTNDGGAGTPAGTLANTDTITIRFQRDGIITDCHGSELPKDTSLGDIVTNVFRVDANNELECSNKGGAPTTWRPVLEDVQDMQVLYGEDTDADGAVDQYRNGANVSDFSNVLSVRLALLLASNDDVKPTAESKSYTLLDKNVTTPPASAPDRIQRRVIERVIALRNRLP